MSAPAFVVEFQDHHQDPMRIEDRVLQGAAWVQEFPRGALAPLEKSGGDAIGGGGSVAAEAQSGTTPQSSLVYALFLRASNS